MIFGAEFLKGKYFILYFVNFPFPNILFFLCVQYWVVLTASAKLVWHVFFRGEDDGPIETGLFSFYAI